MPLVASAALKCEPAMPAERQTALATADSLQSLLESLYVAGEYAESARVTERQLATRRRILGPEHRDIAESLCALGLILAETGDLCFYLRHEPIDVASPAKPLWLDNDTEARIF